MWSSVGWCIVAHYDVEAYNRASLFFDSYHDLKKCHCTIEFGRGSSTRIDIK